MTMSNRNKIVVPCLTTTAVSSMDAPRHLRKSKRQSVARVRSCLFVIGYATLIFALTYRNMGSLLVHRQAHPIVERSLERRDRYLRSYGGTTSDGLRYLSFGTVSNSSYPSYWKNVRRVSDSYTDLAAACTKSLLGNDGVFDVITIEYDEWTASHAVLASRIRIRFPASVIVYVKQINLDEQLILSPRNVSFAEWKRAQRTPIEDLSQSMADAALLTDNGHWRFKTLQNTEPTVDATDSLLMKYILEPTSNLRSADDIAHYLELFDLTTRSDFSESGHRRIASDISSLTAAMLPPALHRPTGDWGSGDDCHVWFRSGDISVRHTGRHLELATNLEHRHVIEFLRSNAAPTISISNPFSTERLLSLTYLTDSDSVVYAKTRISINGHAQSVVLPFHDDEDGDLRLARTTGVGFVPPGRSVVRIEPLTDLPFQLAGASLFAQESLELQSLEFAFERDALRVVG